MSEMFTELSVTSMFTGAQIEELTRLGFTIGYNSAYLLGADEAPCYFIWDARAMPYGSYPGRYIADSNLKTGDISAGRAVSFDDPIAAAVWLLTEVANGTA